MVLRCVRDADRPLIVSHGSRFGGRWVSGTPSAEVGIMPAGSSKKRERQYEHIKESYQERGVSRDEAEERAARTVNKQRRAHGETKQQHD